MLYDPKWKAPTKSKAGKPRGRTIKAKGLTKNETKYMLRVLEMLKSGEIGELDFAMETTICPHVTAERCGTVGCIGGWMGILQIEDELGIIGAHGIYDRVPNWPEYFAFMRKPKFDALFYSPYSMNKSRATPQDAIRAIENFLYKGQKQPWHFMTQKKEYKNAV